MKLMCAWCNTAMGEKYSDVHSKDVITHGICNSCMDTLFVDKNIDFIPFLNTLDAPVILIDENNTYLSANDSALKILAKEHQHLAQKRTGDIFTCENAHLDGGCGHTDRCGGCDMLQLITDTYEGKDSFSHVPVTITKIEADSRQELNLELTTEKVNNFVLMRIDNIKP